MRVLLLFALLIAVVGFSDCELSEHDLDGSLPERAKKNIDDAIPRETQPDKKERPLHQKRVVCKWPTTTTIDPPQGSGVLEGINESACAFFVLPPIGKATVEGTRLNETDKVCSRIAELEVNLKSTKERIQTHQEAIRKDPDELIVREKLLKRAEKNLQDIMTEYEKLKAKEILSVKLILTLPFAELEKKYQTLNAESTIPFLPLPLTLERIDVGSTLGPSSGLRPFESHAFPSNYVLSLSGYLNLGYPLACEENRKERIQISAYFRYRVSLGFVHYQLKLNESKILARIIEKESASHEVSKADFEELLKADWDHAAWKLEWLGEPLDKTARQKIERALKMKTLEDIAESVGVYRRPMSIGAPRVKLGWHFDYILDPSKVAQYKQEHADNVIEYKGVQWESGLVEVPYVFIN